MSIILSIALFLGSEAPTQSNNNQPLDCSYDLDAMLELNRSEFDQDLNGGWRPLASKKGCKLAAAELIREWRFHKRSHDATLYWHEGQLRALAGQTQQAVELFSLTHNPQDHDEYGWNYYVDGTIAYLVQNRKILDLSVERYKALALKNRDTDNKTADDAEQWPVNLRLLIAFQKCFGKSYTEGYTNCRNL